MLLCTINLSRAAAVLMAALLVLAAPVAAVVAQGPAYLADVDDLPLAPGLVEDAEGRIAFDKPEGRIVRALATGPADLAIVRAFYAETLPALGWQPVGQQTWTRGKETLRLNLDAREGVVVVRFAIAPSAP